MRDPSGLLASPKPAEPPSTHVRYHQHPPTVEVANPHTWMPIGVESLSALANQATRGAGTEPIAPHYIARFRANRPWRVAGTEPIATHYDANSQIKDGRHLINGWLRLMVGHLLLAFAIPLWHCKNPTNGPRTHARCKPEGRAISCSFRCRLQ